MSASPEVPEPSFSLNASAKGHAPDTSGEVPPVPSQAFPQSRNIQAQTRREEHGRVRDGSLYDQEDDGEWALDDFESDIRRAKVYELIGQRWTDRGTAFCQGDYDEETREAKLVAKNEQTGEVLLQCTIHASDYYRRQQEKLIVWTEPNGVDYALSFQDVDGCTEVWDFICEVQRHLQQVAKNLNPPGRLCTCSRLDR